jgi:hypothetical protein
MEILRDMNNLYNHMFNYLPFILQFMLLKQKRKCDLFFFCYIIKSFIAKINMGGEYLRECHVYNNFVSKNKIIIIKYYFFKLKGFPLKFALGLT